MRSSPRDLDWEGLANARDLGGLPTRSGHRTRQGAFVRSEALDRLTPAGWSALTAHGIRTCVDLRSGFERDARPYAPPVPVAVVSSPWEEGLLDDPEFLGWAQTGVLGSALYYAPFLERWPERTAAVVADVAAAAPGGIVYHCQRGRDRTGLLTLVLLALAGVPDEVIVADVIASDARLAVAGVDLTPEEVAVEAELYAGRGTTAAETLSLLLDGLDVEHLLRSAGIDGDVIDGLRARLVEV